MLSESFPTCNSFDSLGILVVMISTQSEALYIPLIDIVYRLSIIVYRLSVIAYRLFVIVFAVKVCRLSFIGYRFCGYRLSFIVLVVGLEMRLTVNLPILLTCR